MVLQALARVGARRRGAGINPKVRAPASFLAELDIVDVRRVALFEQREQLMLGAVEAPIPALVLAHTIRLIGERPSCVAAA